MHAPPLEWSINFAVPPSTPSVSVLKTSPDTISLRWTVSDDGSSPVTKTIIYYKMTYGEWSSEEVSVMTCDLSFLCNFSDIFRWAGTSRSTL